jgi:hypothetical protein
MIGNMTAEEFIEQCQALAEDHALSQQQFEQRFTELLSRLKPDERERAATYAFARVSVKSDRLS